MMTYEQSKKAVTDAIAQFPLYFGLRAFPGDTFRLSEQASYTCDGVVYLYTQKKTPYIDRKTGKRDWRWEDFCKGLIHELKAQVTDLPDMHEDTCKDGIDKTV